MKFGIVVFPGSTCDSDVFYSLTNILDHQAKYLWHQDKLPSDIDCVILPGGFSYGDYLRPGAISSNATIMKDIVDFANSGGLTLGICNGFQVLLEAGLLPGALMKNSHIDFICKTVQITPRTFNTPFTNNIPSNKILSMPVAHGDGNYFVEPKMLDELKRNNQIVFKYSDSNGNFTDKANPNGAIENIAGVCNARGNVLGMMPHPERACETLLGSTDGLLIFQSIISYLGGK